MSGNGRSVISLPSPQVMALQALQDEIESLRHDINVLKRVVAEKEQEMLFIPIPNDQAAYRAILRRIPQ